MKADNSSNHLSADLIILKLSHKPEGSFPKTDVFFYKINLNSFCTEFNFKTMHISA